MALRKYVPPGDAPSVSVKPLIFSSKVHEKKQLEVAERNHSMEPDVDIDLREVYFLIMHFLSAGPCHRTFGQFWNELLEHQLLPRRYHAWYSRSGGHSGDENDDGFSFPLSYNKLVERYPNVEKDHLVKLLKQLMLSTSPPSRGMFGGSGPNAADVPTLLGADSFSLLSNDRNKIKDVVKQPPAHMQWPHMKADQVRGLSLREIGGGFTRHRRAPSVRAACYAIAKPSTMVQKMQNIKRLRGHRNAVYCAIFDRSGRYVITGSDDRLVKIWSMETAYCLASCRGHDGDITDLAVSSNNALVASSSNDCIIRVWRLPDGLPISVLRGHTGAVTAIAFSPRPSSIYQLLSSSDDGTCRIWDARYSQSCPRIYVPRPSDSIPGRSSGPSSSTFPQSHQIFCCTFNANGTVFVTGSSDNLARVWNACKLNADELDQPNHEIDILSGHENDVNYVQFSGCAVASRFTVADTWKEEHIPKFKNSWFNHDNIVTCSRDGSAIIWIPKSRRSHGKSGRWTRAYHLRVPPPPMPPQPQRGGPRQRILPTPRGVNMIVWSLDNRFVLAAIMDCRICVWNAADGSLVHSLTGHTESTYVLDVHPFNPRIAMSAGYDGKTIVWDIWEGTPIRIYEISRFKLVDGKFSPDGTSIILSDDVGQLYILNTGQGESQKDAKYDQFFLGDYRPLIQDTNGNVLDQETQLVPYRRNMQDLLCDSAMIPYPEPYQSSYQQRRLGALSIEWRPSSLKLAVGPDFSLDPDYHLLPLADLDVLTEPLPEIIDAMDWQPENEVRSDDNDSEYNVTEDYSTGGEQGISGSNSSSDAECSTEDSEMDTHMDGLRRSKRKKQKTEIEIMTSSGRRVKRRNLDECDGNPLRSNRSRKGSGRKASRRKSSTSKSSRPRRAAARNALNLFSKITGTPTDQGDEDSSEFDCSESESTLQDSNIDSDESEQILHIEPTKNSKGKEVSSDEFEEALPHEFPETRMDATDRRKLVLKFPVWGSGKHVPMETTAQKFDNQGDLGATSSKSALETPDVNRNRPSSEVSGYYSGDVDCSSIERARKGKLHVPEDQVDMFSGYINRNIRWGGVKTRTSKRLRMGEAISLDAHTKPCIYLDGHSEKETVDGGSDKTEKDLPKVSPHLEIKTYEDRVDGVELVDVKSTDTTCEGPNGVAKSKEHSCFSGCGDEDGSLNSVYMNAQNGTDHPPGENMSSTPVSTELRSKRTSVDPESPSKHESKPSFENLKNGTCNKLHENNVEMTNNSAMADDDSTNKVIVEHGEDGFKEMDTQIDKVTSSSRESVELHLQRDKMYNVVYRRSKSHRARTNLRGVGGMEASTSHESNSNLNAEISFPKSENEAAHIRECVGKMAATICPNIVDDNLNLQKGHEYSAIRSGQNGSANGGHSPHEELGSRSNMTVGLRSTRSRRPSSYVCEVSSINRRKSYQSARKGSWLMLSTHEEGCRYIPQQGDEVAYLRQGHHEYIEYSAPRELGPWMSVKGNIRAVEFCKVETLEYATLPGSGDSCCKMTLQFVDPSSSVFSKSFKLTLPEVTSFPDFLVERARFDAAMQRNWTHRDKCKVWWKNEGDLDGSWWDGRILSVQPKSSDFPDSPWERYTIRYKSDPTETHLHSPWELFDADTQWEQPHIDDESRNKLQSAFDKLNKSGNTVQDRYGVQELKRVSNKSKYMNRFPVPLSLEVIQSRLENNYYRTLEALKHDVTVMLSNAKSYFEKDAELSAKIRRLSEWFAKISFL
ncbi:Bromodomain and WD repeat-containing protein [Quillaja saponaria]|uniref:Bromodomain and WD repeat-containing protein n=1 Tax=Quillaja saponaria TaxID=32244 RepID=A0AAD7LDC8_QUISA|nr:Bromodomain and WD repeat-containing protein [Quillaja saponaria]